MERFCPVCSRVYGDEVTHCELDGEKLVILNEEPSLVGHVLDGKYTLISKLGEGGMGSVYLAEQTSMGREVAIKVLRREFSQNRMAIKRFLREARAASKLAHPNTITVYDFGQSTDGLLYLVMERLSGRPLGDILDDEGRMTPERTVHILAQVCDSLSEAHAHGITHRDLKPENIFIEQKVGNPDFVKVLDFGIAKMQGDDSTQATATGMICGTPSYMSPEQAMGRDIDGRSDIYALGILLFEMLTDEKPFEGDTPMEVMLKHINEPSPNILERTRLGVPEGLQGALDRMLTKDATARPAHCQEVKKLLVEGLATPTVNAPRLDMEILRASADAPASEDGPTEERPSPFDVSRSERSPSSLEKTGLSPVVPPEAFAQPSQTKRSRAGLVVLAALAAAAIVLLVLWIGSLGNREAGTAVAGDPPTIGENNPTHGVTGTTTGAPAPEADPSVATAEVGADAEVAKVEADDAVETNPDAGTVTGAVALAVADRAFALKVAADTPAPPDMVNIRVESTPVGAQVYDGEALLGETPVDVEREKDSGEVVLTLRKPRYAAKRVTVGTAGNITQHVRLARLRRPGATNSHGGGTKPDAETGEPGDNDGKKPGGGFGTF